MKKTLKIDNKRVQSKISGISLTLVLLLQIFFMSYVVIDKGFTQEVQGFSNPVGTPVWTYTTGNDIVSTPAIADLDNDGKVEVVFGSKDSKIYCLYGENSTLKWSYTTGEIYSSP